MQNKRRSQKGTVLVEYGLALGAIAGTAAYAFAILGFNVAILVKGFDNCIDGVVAQSLLAVLHCSIPIAIHAVAAAAAAAAAVVAAVAAVAANSCNNLL